MELPWHLVCGWSWIKICVLIAERTRVVTLSILALDHKAGSWYAGREKASSE